MPGRYKIFSLLAPLLSDAIISIRFILLRVLNQLFFQKRENTKFKYVENVKLHLNMNITNYEYYKLGRLVTQVKLNIVQKICIPSLCLLFHIGN